MPTKAISFLGYTRPDQPYRETTYCYQGQECTTPFMAEATARFFKPDALLVLVTQEAEAQNFPVLEDRIGHLLPVEPVHIPSCKTEDELWQMFTIMAEQIAEGDTIIFDITNGFRSLPVLAFLAASYIRVVRQAEVEKMVYGAFDASVGGKTPVFDLTPFVRLLDWTTATDAFIKFGRFTEIGKLLDSDAVSSNVELSRLAGDLDYLSRGLHTSRTQQVMQKASHLAAAIDAATAGIEGGSQPFSLLLDRIKQEYGGLGLGDLRDKKQVLARLLTMIDWYLEKDLLIQAMTLAREWLVSLIVYHLGGDMFDDRHGNKYKGVTSGHRQQAEELINTGRLSGDGYLGLTPDASAMLPRVQQIWRRVNHHSPDNQEAADIRNDLAHCGMGRNPREPDVIAKAVKEICQGLRLLMPA